MMLTLCPRVKLGERLHSYRHRRRPAMVLGALAALIELEPDMRVVAQVRDGQQALAATLEHQPDVLITDIEMPLMSGLDLACELQNRRVKAKVIVLTTFARPGYLKRALDAGARAYMLKESPSRELAAAIRRVHAGEQVVNSRLAADALAERDPLTDREREILQLSEGGASSGEIAVLLQLSKGTVRNHLSQAIAKLSARTPGGSRENRQGQGLVVDSHDTCHGPAMTPGTCPRTHFPPSFSPITDIPSVEVQRGSTDVTTTWRRARCQSISALTLISMTSRPSAALAAAHPVDEGQYVEINGVQQWIAVRAVTATIRSSCGCTADLASP